MIKAHNKINKTQIKIKSENIIIKAQTSKC